MTDEMIVAMATDLNVRQFARENKLQYVNRLLYSAMASWIKTAALDRSVSFITSIDQGVSRRHILNRCDSILTEMLRRFPAAKLWFETDPRNEGPIQLLRSRLIRHGDLLNIGFQSNVTLAHESIIQLNSDLVCGKGYLLEPSFFYSGIAMIRKQQSEQHFEGTDITDSCEWMQEYIKSVRWNPAGSLEGVEYFNPFRKVKSNYQCWQDTLPTAVENIVFARHATGLAPAKYLLIKPGENPKLHYIDSFLQKTGEYRRFQFALRRIVGNNLSTDAKIYRDHVYLKLSFYLPEQENRLLESFAWPYKSVADKFEWDMVSSVWPYTKRHLEKLGIEIREETLNG